MRSGAYTYSINNAAYLNTMTDRALVRSRTSDKYLHIDSMDLIVCAATYLESAGIEFDVQIIGGASSKSTLHIVQFTLLNVGGRSDGLPRILFWNSYNGESSLKVAAGFYRFCCANGLVIGTGDETYRVRHWDDIYGVTQQSVCHNIQTAVAEGLHLIKAAEQRIARLSSIEVDWNQQSDIILKLKVPATVAVEALKRRHPDNVIKLRPEDRDNTLWNVLNTVNEVVHETARNPMAEVNTNLDLIEEFETLAKAA